MTNAVSAQYWSQGINGIYSNQYIGIGEFSQNSTVRQFLHLKSLAPNHAGIRLHYYNPGKPDLPHYMWDITMTNENDLSFGYGADTNDDPTIETRVHFTNYGAVGIKTSSPQATLDINGRLRVQDNIEIGNNWINADGSDYKGINISTNGRVLVNNSNFPGSSIGLMVYGQSYFDDYALFDEYIYCSGSIRAHNSLNADGDLLVGGGGHIERTLYVDDDVFIYGAVRAEAYLPLRKTEGYEITTPESEELAERLGYLHCIKNQHEEKNAKYMLQSKDIEYAFPELMQNDSGKSYVDYTSLIAIMTEVINMQNEKITNQEKRLQEMETKMRTDNNSSVSHNNYQLYQNIPNPSKQSNTTTINYYLPFNNQNAYIVLKNKQGNEITRFENLVSGNGSITIRNQNLKPDYYFYSLIVEDVIIDTKKIIITK